MRMTLVACCLALALALALAGCASHFAEVNKMQEVGYHDYHQQRFIQKCMDYGFEPHTESIGNCVVAEWRAFEEQSADRESSRDAAVTGALVRSATD